MKLLPIVKALVAAIALIAVTSLSSCVTSGGGDGDRQPGKRHGAHHQHT